jgi:hypothetical protein
MIFTRIKRGATRSLLLAKHKLSSSPRLTSPNSWRKARNFILNAMVVRAIVLPIPLLAPSSVVQAASGDVAEPPSIVRLSAKAADALTFTPSPTDLLSIQKDSGLQAITIGKSLASQEAEKAASDAQAAADAAQKAAEEVRTQAAQVAAEQVRMLAEVAQPILSDATAIMDAVGIADSDRAYVDYIVNHESGWGGTQTWNHSGSGAYGICQALPGNKMSSTGADWATNPVTQLRWCDGYAKGRYGSWAGAYQYWITHYNW